MDWHLIIIGISLLLVFILIVAEIRRANRSRLWLRLAATFLAVASLASLVLPVSIPSKKKVVESDAIILLTEGAVPDSIRQFLNGRELPIYTTSSSLMKEYAAFRPCLLPSWEHVVHNSPDRTLHVFGFGFEKSQAAIFVNRSVRVHPAAIPTGVISADWPKMIKAGARFTIQGKYQKGASEAVKLVLRGLNTNLDSTVLKAGQRHFQLSTVPKHLGRAEYSLLILSGKDTISANPVPVQIRQADRLKVLMLAGSPGFENKFLRNWLENKEYAAVTRTRISKDKFDQTLSNTSVENFTQISSSLLKQFDILVTDASELAAISEPEKAAIRREVEENGMGLIVTADSTISGLPYSQHFPISREPVKRDLAPVKLANLPGGPVSLSEETPAFIRARSGTQPLLYSERDQILASSRLSGIGTVIFSTLKNTYRLVLADQKRHYHVLWDHLLTKAARRRVETERWSQSPAYPVMDDHVSFEVASNELVPKFETEEMTLYPAQGIQLGYVWRSSMWPQRTGWMRLPAKTTEPAWTFIYGNESWKTLKRYERLKETMRLGSAPSNISSKTLETVEKAPISKTYFLLLFILCCAFLWIETKFL